MQTTNFDVGIIGGGLAGAASAVFLARKGVKVLLLERDKEPHHKVCGEFLSHECEVLLNDLGLDLASLNPIFIDHCELYSRNTKVVFNFDQRCLSIPRKILDQSILQIAERNGCQVQRGILVQNVERQSDAYQFVAGTQKKFRARQFFLATGKWDLKKFRSRPLGKKRFMGVKFHISLTAERANQIKNCIQLFTVQDGYVGVSLVSEDVANVCFAVSSHLRQELGRDSRSTLYWLGRQNAFFKEFYGSCDPLFEQPLFIGDVPYGYFHNEADLDFFCLGDQLGVVPSFIGEGMSLALSSAKLASATYLAGGSPREYYEKMRNQTRGGLRIANSLHQTLIRPTAFDFVLRLMKLWPGLPHFFMRATRVGDSSLNP